MDELDQYGTAIRRLEGVCTLTHGPQSEQEGPPAYFEARQVDDNSIIIGCLRDRSFAFEPPLTRGPSTSSSTRAVMPRSSAMP